MDKRAKGTVSFQAPARDCTVLRRAGTGDSELAFEIRRAAFKPQFDLFAAWDEDEERRRHIRRFTTQDYRFILDGDVPVGVLAVEVTSDCISVNQLCVLPAQQGRGFGRDAIRHLLQEADREGLPVRLQVLKTNPRAFNFYLELGFVEAGATGTHLVMERARQRGLSTPDVVP